MRWTRCLVAVAAVSSLLSPPSAPSARAAETLRISGTGAGIGGMRLVAAAFGKKHPGVAVSVISSTGSTGGIRAVNEEKLDLACSSRALTEAEKKDGAVEERYALTAIVFGAQASNPTAGFTLREIEDIYAGRQGGWPDGRRIRLSLRPASDAFTAHIGAYTPGMKAALERAATVPGVFVGSTDQDAAVYIEKTPGSFGATSLSLILSEKRKIKTLSVNGVFPTEKTVADGSYPWVLPLSIVYRSGRLSGRAKEFVDFLYSAETADILRKNGHAPVGRGAAKP